MVNDMDRYTELIREGLFEGAAGVKERFHAAARLDLEVLGVALGLTDVRVRSELEGPGPGRTILDSCELVVEFTAGFFSPQATVVDLMAEVRDGCPSARRVPGALIVDPVSFARRANVSLPQMAMAA